MTTAFDALRSRGLIENATEGAAEALAKGPVVAYAGFDPTAQSLHVGNLLPMLILIHLGREGHTPIFLIGSGTATIGDPSGRSQERNLLTRSFVDKNAGKIAGQVKQVWSGAQQLLSDDRSGMLSNQQFRVIENSWLEDVGLLDFLRDTGKHFTINHMLDKESVRARLDTGISFTEFSYMLLQAYDFLWLKREFGCSLQVGGGDQWGNITAGIELIRREGEGKAYGLTVPLLTTATGSKFGKTAEGAIWLDRELTSPFDFYQYWFRTADSDVENYLRLFSFLRLEEIERVTHEHRADPEKRIAQRRLAECMTDLIHGKPERKRVEEASKRLYDDQLSGLDDSEITELFSNAPTSSISQAQLSTGIKAIELFHIVGLCRSKGEARRLIADGGAYLNNHQIADPTRTIDLKDLASKSYLVLRKGKKHYHLVRFE